MNDSANRPQTALLVGRTSDIAVAILEQLTTLRVVVLAARDLERASLAAEKLKSTNAGLSVTSVHFEALDVATHAQLIQDAVRQVGDIDVVMVACGALGSPDAGTGPLEHHHQAMEVTHATTSGATARSSSSPVPPLFDPDARTPCTAPRKLGSMHSRWRSQIACPPAVCT